MVTLLVDTWRKCSEGCCGPVVAGVLWVFISGCWQRGGWRAREGVGELGSLGNASSGQSGTVGARVAGPFVRIIQCDTRETKTD